jgi:hypothetical protein
MEPKPVTDLSPRVVSLARQLDRLPPGEYTIKLEKPDLKAEPWEVNIVRTEKIIDMFLDRSG